MMISTVALVGALGVGTVSASLKAYRERKRKEQYPWTVAAERIGAYPLVKPKRENRFIATGKTTFSKLMEQQKRLFPSDMRQQQLATLSEGSDEAEISVEEQDVNRLLAVSLGTLPLAIAGSSVPALLNEHD